ncbi:TRAP transporter small permease [Allosediminivita pacifica]|nr:TRAP transporter small permease [Allosediminivita pacifica]
MRRILDVALGAVMSLLLGGMVAVLAWQVFSRYALNSPSVSSEEILRMSVVWLSLLGAAYSCGKGTHMSIELLHDLVPGPARRALTMLVPVSFIVFAGGVMIPGGLRAMEIANGQTTAVLRLPMPWIYASLPVSGTLFVAYSLLNLVDLVRHRRDQPDEADKLIAAGD